MVVESLVAGLRVLCATLQDRRKGTNTVHAMADIGMAAFATFFMQSPSFLTRQKALARGRGAVNCRTLFAMFDATLAALEQGGGLAAFSRLDGHVLIALDGTEYFCSQKLSCPNCSSRLRANGKTEHFHAMVSAAMVAPGHARALPLEPEFILQDGGSTSCFH